MGAGRAAPVDDGSGQRTNAFLSSLQLTDSFFPSGLYALSHGLETFVQAGLLKPEGLQDLLTDYLRHGIGPADGAALACAHRGGTAGDLDLAVAADLRLTGVKLPREARESSTRSGRQLLRTASQIFGGALLFGYAERARCNGLPVNHAIALGLTMATLGIEREHAVAAELYAFSASLVGSSVRLALIDHRFAQAVLHAVKPVTAELARIHSESSVRDIASSTPLIDIMAMRHERAELRLFMS